jgi:hypothetical protein
MGGDGAGEYNTMAVSWNRRDRNSATMVAASLKFYRMMALW